jgi:phenylacetate-CoA ligase
VSRRSHLHPELEAMSLQDLRTIQETKWSRQWEYVRTHSPFYRKKLMGSLEPGLTLDGLQDLPLTDKDELRQSQQEHPPFGDYMACPPDAINRIHHTSGTTGRALIIANTRRDLEVIARLGSRGFFASGLRPRDRVIHCLNYQLWTGGVTDHMALEGTGAAVIPFGVGGTRRLVETVRYLGATAISCTPSYPAMLERTLREDFDLEPRDLGLRLALFGGEAGLDSQEFRHTMEARWGFGVRNANFGLSEIMSIIGSQCEETNDLHFIGADALFIELLDPESGQRLMIDDGVSGELVCTHIEKECQPLVRYRTRDILTVTGAGPCRCGRTGFRFRVSGRTDDMFNVRGINVFPTAIQRIIVDNPALASGHFRIVLHGPGPYERIILKVEAASSLPPERWRDAGRQLENAIRASIGASAEIEMLAFETLPRTESKTSMIERG